MSPSRALTDMASQWRAEKVAVKQGDSELELLEPPDSFMVYESLNSHL
jgi:hypothetical protein